jgi:molybdate transport system permease protein
MVALILAAYVVFVSSSAVYLGASDAWHFMTQPKMWERFRLTALTATMATALSVLVGIPAGYAISRKRLPWPTLSNTVIDLPMMVPPAALGLLLLGVVWESSTPSRSSNSSVSWACVSARVRKAWSWFSSWSRSRSVHAS